MSMRRMEMILMFAGLAAVSTIPLGHQGVMLPARRDEEQESRERVREQSFTEEEIEHLRSLPKRDKKAEVARLRAKYARKVLS
jgi:hypothetical protein